MNDLSKLRVAIVHDWLYGGGAERVVLELHHMFPSAPIYTSYCSDEWRRKLDGKVVTGYLQKQPFAYLRKFVGVLRIFWFMSLDLSRYDLVISSAGNGEAKSVRVPSGSVHVVYCHSPTHFYWRHYDQYLKHPGFGLFDPLARLGLRILVGPLRWWDKHSAQKPQYFIANSSHIQSDIKRYYGRDSVVVFPPVDVDRFRQAEEPEKRYGFVTVGRQVPYKRTDLIVKACTRLGLPLAVIGRGPEHKRLQQMAGPSVAVMEADDAEVARYMRSAEAFIFAAHEDFGITPIEAMAAGTPVIAYRAGGALDYVQPGVTGEFFGSQSVKSLTAALETFDSKKYDHKKVAAEADQFSAEAFRRRMTDALREFTSKPPRR